MKRTTSMTVLNNYIENTSEYLNNFKKGFIVRVGSTENLNKN